MSAEHEGRRDGAATLELPDWPQLTRLARHTERFTAIPGLASFLIAKAKQVSNGIASAMHGGELGQTLFDAHRVDPAIEKRFAANPWWPSGDDDSLAERWTFLGGWFGLPPTFALATSDGAGLRHDPVTVFVPTFAVAYATDYVVRLARQTEPPMWSELWDRWSARLPSIGFPALRRKDSLADSLTRSLRRGADPKIVDQRVQTAEYPGFDAVARQLEVSELRLVPAAR